MLSAVLAALLADAATRLVAADFRDRLDPVLGIPARFARRFHDKLNLAVRSRGTRAARGVVTFILIVLVGGILGVGFGALARENEWVAPFIWFLCLRAGAPWGAGVALLRKPEWGADALQRYRVPVLVPTKSPDNHAVIRMVIEAAATSLHRGVLTPVFWAGLGVYVGVDPIAVAVLTVTLLEADRVIATPENAGTPFVHIFEIVEKIINFVPARVAALLYVLGALFVPGGRPGAAFLLMFRQGEKHILIDSGWPIAAVAGALNVALPAGRGRDGWIGGPTATARAGSGDLRRALWLHGVTSLLAVLIFAAMILLGLGS